MVPNNSTSAVAVIAAMITPALLILGSASLVTSALLHMARVVDRTRVITSRALEGHLERLRYAEGLIALLFCAIVVFIATCLSIAVTQLLAGSLRWVPVVLAVCGTLLLLVGVMLMVAECRASAPQIREEIAVAIALLEKPKS